MLHERKLSDFHYEVPKSPASSSAQSPIRPYTHLPQSFNMSPLPSLGRDFSSPLKSPAFEAPVHLPPISSPRAYHTSLTKLASVCASEDVIKPSKTLEPSPLLQAPIMLPRPHFGMDHPVKLPPISTDRALAFDAPRFGTGYNQAVNQSLVTSYNTSTYTAILAPACGPGPLATPFANNYTYSPQFPSCSSSTSSSTGSSSTSSVSSTGAMVSPVDRSPPLPLLQDPSRNLDVQASYTPTLASRSAGTRLPSESGVSETEPVGLGIFEMTPRRSRRHQQTQHQQFQNHFSSGGVHKHPQPSTPAPVPVSGPVQQHHPLAPMSLNKDIKRRTKTGCITCRRRRIKCDERRSTCTNCGKSRRVCLGYDPLFERTAFMERRPTASGTRSGYDGSPTEVKTPSLDSENDSSYFAMQPTPAASPSGMSDHDKAFRLSINNLLNAGELLEKRNQSDKLNEVMKLGESITDWTDVYEFYCAHVAPKLDAMFSDATNGRFAAIRLQGGQTDGSYEWPVLEAMRQLIGYLCPSADLSSLSVGRSFQRMEEMRQTYDYRLLQAVVLLFRTAGRPRMASLIGFRADGISASTEDYKVYSRVLALLELCADKDRDGSVWGDQCVSVQGLCTPDDQLSPSDDMVSPDGSTSSNATAWTNVVQLSRFRVDSSWGRAVTPLREHCKSQPSLVALAALYSVGSISKEVFGAQARAVADTASLPQMQLMSAMLK